MPRRPKPKYPQLYPVFEPESRTLDFNTASDIRDEHALGKTTRMLAKEFGVPEKQIVQVLDRILYGDAR